MTEFSGNHVLIKALKPGDLDQVLAWSNESEESFFLLNFSPLLNRDDLARELAHRDTEVLLISAKKDNTPLGLIKYGPVRLPEKQTQIRFTLDTYPEYSAELALDGPTTLLAHLFNKKGITKVHAYTLEFEKEYESLLQKLGFVKEGSYKHHFFHKEKYYAVNIFGLFKKEFTR